MRIIEIIFVVGFVTIVYLGHINAKNKFCYLAKTCIHDGKERCGADAHGNIRRFLDTCDIKEFNCLRDASYVKVSSQECIKLPPIDEENMKGKDDGKEAVKEKIINKEQVTAETEENDQDTKENGSLSIENDDENDDVDKDEVNKRKKKYRKQ